MVRSPPLSHDKPSPWKLPFSQWRLICLESWREAGDDNIGLIAAGVAFYGFLALVPLLAAVVLTYGVFAEPDTVIHDVKKLASIMPAEAARLVGQQLMELVKASDGKKGLGVLAALAIALFGARNGAGSIITALNIAFEVKETRGFLRLNVLALAITAAAVVTAIAALVAVAALGHLQHLVPAMPEVLLIAGKIASYLVLAGVGMAAAATLYRYGPSHENVRWTWITPGSLLATVCWLALTLGFGLYASEIGHFNATYGSLSTVVVMLTWLYFSSYALLFGAEINCELVKHKAGMAQEVHGGHRDRQEDESSFLAGSRPQVSRPSVSEIVEALPFGLAATGLNIIKRKEGAGKGVAFLALAAVSMWLRRSGPSRGA